MGKLTPPKRVLHIVSAMNRGGTETLLMNVYRMIDRSLLQFDFVSHQPQPCDFDEEIEAMGGKVHRIRSLGQSGPLRYMQQINKIIKAENYIAVHAHTDYQAGLPALAAKLSGIQKIICHAHTNQWTMKKGIRNKLTFRILQTFIHFSSTNYCACSKDAACFLFGNQKMDQGQVNILNNSIPVDHFINQHASKINQLKKELAIEETQYVIGHVGNFSEVKNQSYIIKILKELRKNGENCIAVFAGDGPLRKRIEAEAAELQLSEFTRFLGVRHDIATFMHLLDAFIFPSKYEGFGMVVVEAQCAGIPCIVSDTVPETTDMGLNLITYKSLQETPVAWADIVTGSLKQTKPDKEIIKQQFLAKGFAIQEIVPKWLALYGIG